MIIGKPKIKSNHMFKLTWEQNAHGWLLWPAFVRRHASSVVNIFTESSPIFTKLYQKKLSLDGPVPICKKGYEWNLSRLTSIYVAYIPSLAVLYVLIGPYISSIWNISASFVLFKRWIMINKYVTYIYVWVFICNIIAWSVLFTTCSY